MKSKCLSKSRFIAILCCLCLGLSAMMASIFLFSKQEKVFAETEVSGFYVEDGASVRFDEVRTGLRFKTVVTEEQYNAWKATYGNDATYDFHTVISFATPGDEAVDVDAVADIASHDFANGNFVYYGAVFFDLKDGAEDLSADEITEILSAEYKAESYVLINGDKVNADSEGVLRSIRSVAMSNVLKETVSDTAKNDILKKFIRNESEGALVAPIINVSDDEYFYDSYRDETVGLTITLPGEIPSGVKAVGMVGATAIPETDFIVNGDTVTVKNVAKYLTIGETEFFSLDIPALNTVLSLSNVLDVTEIFYNEKDGVTGVERLNERFAFKVQGSSDAEKIANYFSQENKVTETAIDEEGVAYSMDFYNVDRGYYVMAEDIFFPETPTSWSATSANANKETMNHDALSYNSIFNYGGLFGFGGTFDGRGYTIHNFRTSDITTTYSVSGLFGALAFGATVKNLGFYNANKCTKENARHATVLATNTGVLTNADANAEDGTLAKNGYNFLVAKFGSSDCILIEDCYFDIDKSVVDGTEISVYENPKVYNNYTYAMGSYSVVYEANPAFVTFRNSVLDTFNNNPVYGHVETAGVGWVGRTAGYNFNNDNDGIFENCYMLSETRSTGEIATAFEHRTLTIIDSESGSAVDCGSMIIEEIDGVTYYSYKTYKGTWVNLPSKSYEFYAENDFASIQDGTPVYSGLDGDDWVVSADEKYTANVTLFHYTDLYRFNNFIEMSALNTNALDSFGDAWVKVGGAVIWKGIADKKPDGSVNTDLTLDFINLTNEGSTAFGVGEEIEVKVSYLGKDVSSSAIITTANEGVVDINKNVLTCIATGEIVLNVTVGGFVSSATILVTENNSAEVVVSAKYSEIYGANGDAYSVPYEMDADGNLVQTTYTKLYQDATDNSAVVTAIYELVNGVKTALEIVEVDGEKYVLLAAPENERKVYTIIIEGTKGLVTLGNLSIVTGVISDADGFNYIPSTKETRTGYYVLANDFDNNGRASGWLTRQDSILGLAVGGSDQMGYSFAGISAERVEMYKDNLSTVRTTTFVSMLYDAFTGTFDGLGHTIDNMFIDPVGLLGAFTDESQGSMLKNVKFTNVRAGIYAYGSIYDGENDPVKVTKSQTLLATYAYPRISGTGVAIPTESQVKLENVVIEIATAGHRTDTSNYLGSEENKQWSFFRGERAKLFQDDGTLKEHYFVDQRSNNKTSLNNVVFKYETSDSVGVNSSGVYGATIFSYNDFGKKEAACLTNLYAYKDFNNVYIISEKASNGKMALISAEKAQNVSSNVAMAENDFYAIFTEEFSDNGNTGLYYYTASKGGEQFVSTTKNAYSSPNSATSGWGIITETVSGATTSRLVFVMDITTFGQVGSEYELKANETFVIDQNGNGLDKTIFYPTKVIRYDDYSAMIAAGKTQIGNFVVSATGLTWTEAK